MDTPTSSSGLNLKQNVSLSLFTNYNILGTEIPDIKMLQTSD
jgi:hypothetical protein